MQYAVGLMFHRKAHPYWGRRKNSYVCFTICASWFRCLRIILCCMTHHRIGLRDAGDLGLRVPMQPLPGKITPDLLHLALIRIAHTAKPEELWCFFTDVLNFTCTLQSDVDSEQEITSQPRKQIKLRWSCHWFSWNVLHFIFTWSRLYCHHLLTTPSVCTCLFKLWSQLRRAIARALHDFHSYVVYVIEQPSKPHEGSLHHLWNSPAILHWPG